MGFQLNPTDKRYLAALMVLVGIILFWRGLWDITYLVPIIKNPFVSLFVGLTIITLSGVVFREFDPLTAQIAKTMEVLNEVLSRKNMNERYNISYFDESSKKLKVIHHKNIKKMEHNFLVIEEKGKEVFIPVHRVHKITKNGKVMWKK
jgi:uncharacterized protein (UPF0248 family)